MTRLRRFFSGAALVVCLACAAASGGDEGWWAFQPLGEYEPPETEGLPEAWKGNAIDRFVFQKLKEKGLTPSAEADRRVLIRRATYDLLGLPPTPEEIEQFVKDPRPDAYERLIDRLLASPHYGERWGRHWLDVIRFGESRGFERNEIINTAWPFRDYVIRSFNEDKPFDRLVYEHLAGDVVGKDKPEVEVGTTFLVAGPYDDVGNQDALQAKIIRANTVDEIIGAVSGAFLGLTVSCARCHDHKFDPVTIEDYYRFYAVFAGVFHGERVLATPDERSQWEERMRPLQAERDAAWRAVVEFEQAIRERPGNEPEQKVEPALPKVHPHLTEDKFPPVEARWIRLSVLSNNRDPRNPGPVRIDEFEVWTGEEEPRNVALASAGAVASGPSRKPGDFADAYAVSLVNDGQYGARWIVDSPAKLTIELPKVERIRRITFSADRLKALPPESGEIVFVGEYEIDVSVDGKEWVRVEDSFRRPALDEAFAKERQLRARMTDEDRRRLAELRRTVEEADARIRSVPRLRAVWAGRFDQPKQPVRVYQGGDPARPGEAVVPASLSALDRVVPGFELPEDSEEWARRLALAEWLTCPENPLTPRVLANRVWHYHFGTGIVDTPSDFGRLGGLPTHPELLDWLARRLHFHGWRLKPLHREIMLSQTYRQSSAWREDAAAIDADSRFLWRFPPRRLSAEEIRDTMLSVAGVLRTRMGGPGFKLYRYLQDNVATYIPLDDPGPETYRRAVYHHNARASRIDLMTDFDAPDCTLPAPRRATTTSPLQALTLLNHAFTSDMAEAFAKRLEKECGGADGAERIQRAFALAFGRSAEPREIEAALRLVSEHGMAALCRALFNANELIYLE